MRKGSDEVSTGVRVFNASAKCKEWKQTLSETKMRSCPLSHGVGPSADLQHRTRCCIQKDIDDISVTIDNPLQLNDDIESCYNEDEEGW